MTAPSTSKEAPIDEEPTPLLVEYQQPTIPSHSQPDVSFSSHFLQSNGGPQLLGICLLMALSFGSTIGVVPAIVTNRFASQNYAYMGNYCESFVESIPDECHRGSDDAQDAAVISCLAKNTLAFLMSAMMGGVSDRRGRKGVILLGIVLSMLAPLMLVFLQLFENMNPMWYYALDALGGVADWLVFLFAAMSDIMPKVWRAAGFGLLLTMFMIGIAFGPMMAAVMDHLDVTIVSFVLRFMALVFAIVALPETLSEENKARRREEKRIASMNQPVKSFMAKCGEYLLRPVKDMSILTRNPFLALLSIASFFNFMVFSFDFTVFIYYIESQFSFKDTDVAILFFFSGVMGALVNGVLLKPVVDFMGDRNVLTLAFFLGIVYNFVYGIAKSKAIIYVGMSISTLCKMAFPLLSSMSANNVSDTEQGHIQGARNSLNALASAIGPILLRFIYDETKNRDSSTFGPGTMFYCAALFYFLALVFTCAIPRDEGEDRKGIQGRRDDDGLEVSLLEESLVEEVIL